VLLVPVSDDVVDVDVSGDVVPVAAGVVVSTVVDGAGVTDGAGVAVVSAGGVTVTVVDDGAGVVVVDGSTTTGRSSFFLQAVRAKAMPRVAMSAVVFIHELS